MNMTQEEALNLFEYKDGCLFWKVDVGSRIKKGTKAGRKERRGYFVVGFNYKLYLAHRIIYLMHYGYFPKCVDHIDGNKSNNSIQNLREASLSQNHMNSKLQKNNISGVKGVCWDKSATKWRVRIQTNNKNKYLGLYEDLELAELVAQEARDLYHGKFANHG